MTDQSTPDLAFVNGVTVMTGDAFEVFADELTWHVLRQTYRKLMRDGSTGWAFVFTPWAKVGVWLRHHGGTLDAVSAHGLRTQVARDLLFPVEPPRDQIAVALELHPLAVGAAREYFEAVGRGDALGVVEMH